MAGKKDFMIINGLLCEAKRTVKTFSNNKKSEEKLFISIKNVTLTDAQMQELKDAFAESGKKFTPAWITDFEGYINTSTKFELPFRYGKQEGSLEDLIADGFAWKNAPVRLSLQVKEGAVYPKAIIIDGEGEEFDAFSEFADAEDLPRA